MLNRGAIGDKWKICSNVKLSIKDSRPLFLDSTLFSSIARCFPNIIYPAKLVRLIWSRHAADQVLSSCDDEVTYKYWNFSNI